MVIVRVEVSSIGEPSEFLSEPIVKLPAGIKTNSMPMLLVYGGGVALADKLKVSRKSRDKYSGSSVLRMAQKY